LAHPIFRRRCELGAIPHRALAGEAAGRDLPVRADDQDRLRRLRRRRLRISEAMKSRGRHSSNGTGSLPCWIRSPNVGDFGFFGSLCTLATFSKASRIALGLSLAFSFVMSLPSSLP